VTSQLGTGKMITFFNSVYLWDLYSRYQLVKKHFIKHDHNFCINFLHEQTKSTYTVLRKKPPKRRKGITRGGARARPISAFGVMHDMK
jgi:hypothetical protein